MKHGDVSKHEGFFVEFGRRLSQQFFRDPFWPIQKGA